MNDGGAISKAKAGKTPIQLHIPNQKRRDKCSRTQGVERERLSRYFKIFRFVGEVCFNYTDQ
jgi:hypothetical protein